MSHFMYQVQKLNFCSMNLLKIFIKYFLMNVIQKEDLLQIRYMKSISVAPNQLILQKNLIAADQTAAGLNAPDKTINISRFDKLNVKKNFVEIHGYRYPRDKVLTNFPENDYIDQ